MPILGAILGALFAAFTLGFSHVLWGACVGLLLGAAFHFHTKLNKTEESLTSEIYQLRTRMRDLELKMKNIGSPAVSREAQVETLTPSPAPVSTQKEPLPEPPEPEKTWKSQPWQEASSPQGQSPSSFETYANAIIKLLFHGKHDRQSRRGASFLWCGISP